MRGHLITLLGGAIFRCLRQLPLGVAQRLGAVVGDLAFLTDGAHAKISRTNLQVCFPELSSKKIDHLVRASLRHAGCFIAELGIAWYGTDEQWQSTVTSIEGIDAIVDAQRRGKGVLVLAPHFGNWEILNLVLGARFAVTAMYDPQRIDAFDKLVKRARVRTGSTLVPTDWRGVRALYRALQAGQVVGLLPDQVPSSTAGLYVPFFGHPALTMTLGYRLARNLGPLIVLAYARRLSNGQGFRIVFEKLPDIDMSVGVETALVSMNLAIEHSVRLDASQYMWMYKRFKRSPLQRLY